MKTIGLIAAVSFMASLAFAYSKGGGGADYGRPRPWFPSMTWDPATMQDVKVCSEVASDFGLSDSAARQAAVESFQVWIDYARDLRKIMRNPFGAPDYVDVNFKLIPTCDGSEDLTLYFGSQTDEKRAAVSALSAAFSEPLAFAHKTSETNNKGYAGWGKGFIYVDTAGEISDYSGEPQFSWAQNMDLLKSLLVHELGHVLGCSHTSGTIMDEDLAHGLFDRRYIHPPMIDQARQLFVCDRCSQEYIAATEWFNGDFYDAEKSFRFMTGRDSKGLRHASFHFETGLRESSPYLPTGTLVYADDLGTYKFPVQFDAIATLPGDERWFFGSLNQGGGASYIGRITKADGSQVTVAVNRNTDHFGIFDVKAVVPDEEFGLTLMYANSAFTNLQFYRHR